MQNSTSENSRQPPSYDFSQAVEVKLLPESAEDISKMMLVKFKRPLVLVLEDDEDQLMFFQTMITKAGFEVVPVKDGRTAIEKLEQEVFHAVVSDVQMPKFDGMQFLRTVREKEKFGKLPIIMMTAFVEETTEDKVMQLGADFFCPKKMVTTNLVRLLRQLLR